MDIGVDEGIGPPFGCRNGTFDIAELDSLMSETSGRSDRRSARGSPRRTVTEGRREEQDIMNDDSFSDERFGILNSWESTSFDSEERRSRPSSSLRDRRKQFDTTTPTLIDEEDEYEEELSLEQARLQGFEPPKDDAAIRRTPGAAMYRSVFADSDSETAVSMRRTPGPSDQESGLGYALTLSTPVAVLGEEKGAKPRTWESFAQQQSATPSPISGRHSAETDQPARPPLAPAPAAVGTAARTNLFQPWSKNSASMSPEQRQGAFSPGLLRLTEDIGNLLHEDEDDDYTLEIPSVFRADGQQGEQSAEAGADWTGAFVVETNRNFARKSVPRGAAHAANAKSRRKSSSGQGNFLPNAQQPKPRRSGNEVFEFGSAFADQGSSQQIFNFGGAFAPPAKEAGSLTGSFGQPMSFAQPTPPGPPPGMAFVAPTQPIEDRLPDFGSAPPQQPLVSAASFESYQSGTTRASPTDAFFQPYRYTTPSPTLMMAAPPTSHTSHQSDMQATAQEFVPKSTRSSASTPQVPGSRWPQPTYDTSLDQASWHSTTGGYGFGPSYGYGMQSPSFGDARAGLTPSPHLPSWQQGDPSLYGGSVHSRIEGLHPPQAAPSAQSSQAGAVEQTQRAKKDSKRGKRGKKKSQKAEPIAAVITTTTMTTPTLAVSTASAPKKTVAAKQLPKKKPAERPGSSAAQSTDEAVSASDDPMDSKRAELEESPATRLAFKEFYKSYRTEEQHGMDRAEEFAKSVLSDGSLPDSVHWRVYIELADLARRGNRFAEARRLYQKVCQLQPYASQGWVEYSKLEEECGHMNRVANILFAGLEFCEYNENLLIRAVKHQERMGNLAQARALLARLKHVGIDKVWRSVLEGAMFEARAGNIVMARRVLKYIMYHVPWYGPLYIEFYRLERDHGHPLDALTVVERGLSQIPRYGPLWFSALRVCEDLDFSELNFHLPRTTAMLQRAGANVSKEIAWKVHLEASFIFERAAQEQATMSDGYLDAFLGPARHYFGLTIRTCRLNLRWKVWLAAARMELAAGNTDRARTLFLRAHEVAPEKVRSLTFLDFARLHEFIGETELARAILCKGRVNYGHDWKVWLESVLIELRSHNLSRAFGLASRALEAHHGTGRLWAVLVQLNQHTGGEQAQYAALRQALNAVPKSGEVWCEGARIHLNPFSDLFDLDRARRHLFFAGKFTPQYGDSFLEGVRLELLSQWLSPIADYVWEQTMSGFEPGDGSRDIDCLTKYITDVSLAVSIARLPTFDLGGMPRLTYKHIIPSVHQRLNDDMIEQSLELSEIILACSNADPNYGPLWFNCRRVQTDPPRRVVEQAASAMVHELQKYSHVYIAAMIRRKAVLSTMAIPRPELADGGVEVFDRESMEWEDCADDLLRTFPSLGDIYNPLDPTTGLVLLESTISGSDFVTGLMEFNRHRPIEHMSLLDRKRAIFATDALFP